MNNKGFINILAVGFIALLSLASTAFIAYETKKANLGASILTTATTDTIGTFRTNVNTSLTNLNTELGQVSTTINAYGNITAENTPLAVNKGGTGTTTAPTNGQLFSANGTSTAWKNLVGVGFTIASTSDSLTLTTQGLDTTDEYAWTGGHNFASTTALATTTVSSSLTVSGNTSLATTTITSLTVNGSAISPQTSGNYTFMAGGNLSARDAVYIFSSSTNSVVSGESQLTGNAVLSFGRAGGGTRLMSGQSFMSATAFTRVSTVTVALETEGSPTDDVKISIQANNAGDPSGTPLASSTLAYSSIGASTSTYVFTMQGDAAITADTLYWIVAERTGSADATNYYQSGYNGSDVYASGTLKSNVNGTGWTSVTGDLIFSFTGNQTWNMGVAKQASASATSTSWGTIGFAPSAISSGSNGTIQTTGQLSGFSGLTPGEIYYLSNSAGQISTASGTISKKVGIAVATSTLQIMIAP